MAQAVYVEHGHPVRGPGRALVPVSQGWLTPLPARRPQAGFVAQLIACIGREPGYRERRRGSPSDASASYGRTEIRTRPVVNLQM